MTNDMAWNTNGLFHAYTLIYVPPFLARLLHWRNRSSVGQWEEALRWFGAWFSKNWPIRIYTEALLSCERSRVRPRVVDPGEGAQCSHTADFLGASRLCLRVCEVILPSTGLCQSVNPSVACSSLGGKGGTRLIYCGCNAPTQRMQ